MSTPRAMLYVPFFGSSNARSTEPAVLYHHDDVVRELVEALEAVVRAVCGETGFAEAVRRDSGLAYPWPALDIAEEKARAALANIAQEDQR